MAILRRAGSEIGVRIFIGRNCADSVPEVTKPSVEETRLRGGVDADGRFGDFPGKVVLEVFLQLLFVPHMTRDISHHDRSIADALVLTVYTHRRFEGRLEGVLWVRVPVLGLGSIRQVLGGRKEVSSPHPHKSKRYPQQRDHPGDRDPEDDN